MGTLAHFCACAALLSSAAPLAAAPRRDQVNLTWSGPKDCPSTNEVIARAERLLSKFESPEPPLVARGNVVAETDGLRLELDTWQGDGRYRRTIRAPSCTELADAAALILALLVDPSLRPDSNVQADFKGAETPTIARTYPLRSPSHAPRWGVRAGPVVDIGALPVAAAGLAVGGIAQFGPLRIGLDATGFLPAGQVVAQASTLQAAKGGKFMLFAGKLQACYRPLEELDLGGCMAAELGVLRGEGYGTAQRGIRTVTWAALGPGLEGGVPVAGSLSLRAGADVLLALERPQFVLENVGLVYQPGPVSVRGALGVLLLFP
jgi:hypothetical protein